MNPQKRLTFAVKGEKHQPRQQGAVVNADEQFANQFVQVVAKKLKKLTYEPFFRQYGKGYLVVSIKYPSFGKSTLATVQQVWCQARVLDKGFFKSVYIVYPIFGAYKVSLWSSNLS